MNIRQLVIMIVLASAMSGAHSDGGARASASLGGVQGETLGTEEVRCIEEQSLLKAEQVIHAFGTAIDQHIGFGISGTSLGFFSTTVRNELTPLFRTRKGAATCAPLCVVVPAEEAIDWQFCMQSNGGELCRLTDGAFGAFRASVRGYSTAFSPTGMTQVLCGTVKNWEQGGRRQFSLRARYQ